MISALFVIVLVQVFERAAIDQKRLEARFRRGHSGQDIDPQVKSCYQFWVNRRVLFFLLIHHLDHISIKAGYDAHLINRFACLFGLDFDGKP